jgi:hypothetical protein
MKYISIIIILALIIIFGCDTPQDMNRTGDKLSGLITHFDTNLVLNGGYYSVSLFSADSISPFFRVPVRTDSLRLTRRHDLIVYETAYDMAEIPAGRYYVAATWSRYPKVPNEVPAVLGTYGCDTSRTCSNHIVLVYPNYEGTFRNILSWTDPARRLN